MSTPTPDFVPARYHHLILKQPEHLKLVRNLFALLLWSDLKRKGLGSIKMATAVKTMHKSRWWTVDISTAILNNLFSVWSSVTPPQLNDLHQLYSKACLAHELITVPDSLPKTLRMSVDASDCFLMLHALNDTDSADGLARPELEHPSFSLLLSTMRALAAYTDPRAHLMAPGVLATVGLEVVIHAPSAKTPVSVPWSTLIPPHEDDKPDTGWSRSLAA